MSISSSLNAGVMGLNVNSARLATISNNVANASTYGYKRAEASFSSMVLQQRRNAYAAGGVRVDTQKLVDERGALISTGSSMDIAVAGQGLIPVTDTAGVSQGADERPLMFTPTGAFATDQNGFLRTPGGLFLLGWPADANGDIGGVSRRTGTDLQAVNVGVNQFSAEATTEITMGVNLPALATEDTGTGDPYILPIEYYDNLGKIQSITATFTPVPAAPGAAATNQWTVDIVDDGAVPPVSIGTLNLTFADTPTAGGTILTAAAGGGASYDDTTGLLSLNLSSGPATIDIGRPGESDGITQLSANFAPFNISKNGAPIGDLQAIEIDPQGLLEAVYDTGFRRVLYQIPVAMVPNLNGLSPTDDQAYRISQESGDFYLWDAGEGPVGETAGYALMESTTDIGTEMTDLIRTQRAYASNAKIIQTVDEMLQETTNLIR
ncbi:flagellar hook-basal body complex protein [Parvularcula sp. LCG005]|uniref:flagellar hook protein FlgE n=1 Tax=Parvularcula sp. LCG005 TaxID=3078805 RepID=UPI00294249DF|nr:flagellar hook-basal body complex protein [Parvularcula sp. LCG005]WOI52937.1 flagellar hook-basal body complex protein [Parvularcula sp. LCG005]